MASIANSEDNSARAHVESSGDVGHGGGKSSANNPLLKGDLVKLIFSYTPASSICSLRLVNKTWRAVAAVCNFHWATLMCKTFCPVKSLLTSFKSGSFFQICAGTEGLPAGSRNDDHANVAIKFKGVDLLF